MERTITESGALYFVQHKRTTPEGLRRHGTVPQIWNSRISSMRRPSGIFSCTSITAQDGRNAAPDGTIAM